MQKHAKKIKLTINGKKMTATEILATFGTNDTKHGTTRLGDKVHSPAFKLIGSDVVILGKAGTLKKGISVMPIADFSVIVAHASADSTFTGASLA